MLELLLHGIPFTHMQSSVTVCMVSVVNLDVVVNLLL